MNDLRAHRGPEPGQHHPRLEALYRNSALAFEGKLVDYPEHPPLRVDFGRGSQIDARAFGELTSALQVSTARVARGLLYPAAENIRINQRDIDRAPLVPLGSFGGSLLFGFPKTTVVDRGQEAWPLDTDYTLTEAAVKELVSVLPRSIDDRESIDVLPSQAISVRSAVQSLAEAIKTTGGIRLTLDLPKSHEVVESVLSADQARGVEDALSGTRNRVTEESISALLDGVRTQRRIFYLVKANGTEVHGSVGPELLPQMREYLGRPVVARLQKVVVEDAAGRSRRPVYRLLSLTVDEQIEQLSE